MTARQQFDSIVASDKKAPVELPVNFEEISVLMGISMEDSVSRMISFIEENKKVVPQYHSLLEKIGGMFYGFYYNPCVYAQNNLNDKILTVMKQFCEQEKIKQDLFSRINVLQDRIDELSK